MQLINTGDLIGYSLLSANIDFISSTTSSILLPMRLITMMTYKHSDFYLNDLIFAYKHSGFYRSDLILAYKHSGFYLSDLIFAYKHSDFYPSDLIFAYTTCTNNKKIGLSCLVGDISLCHYKVLTIYINIQKDNQLHHVAGFLHKDFIFNLQH